MSAEATRPPRRLPTALVLALSSLMVTTGTVGFVQSRFGCAPRAGHDGDGALHVRVLDASPSLAAESYLDAWRKRRFDVAMQLSIGDAHAQARTRQRAEAEAQSAAGVVSDLWRELARERLSYVVDETRYEGDVRVQLRGVAEGSFAGKPYRREAEFAVTRQHGHWRVDTMVLGRILEGANMTHPGVTDDDDG